MRLATSLTLGLAVLCLIPVGPVGAQAPTVQLETTINTGEDLAVVVAWAPDGLRLAYGTEKRISRQRSPISVGEGEVDYYAGEVWISDLTGQSKRILKYDFLRGVEGEFFSFSVERLAWSPDGLKLTVELTDEKKNTATFLITAEGKKIKVGSSPVNYVAGYGGGWLSDSESLGLLSEAVNPRLLHQVSLVRITAGRAVPLFTDRSFAAVAWLPAAHKAVLVESDPEFARTPRLAVGDLETGELTVLDELTEGYLGGLRVTPDEMTVSYFVGQEKLAVRELKADAPIEYWPIPVGRYEWLGSRRAVLFLEPEASGRHASWLALYDPARKTRERVLPNELILDFWVSPDGQRVAVLTAGLKPVLKVYRLGWAPAAP